MIELIVIVSFIICGTVFQLSLLFFVAWFAAHFVIYWILICNRLQCYVWTEGQPREELDKMLRNYRDFKPEYKFYSECFHYEDRVNAVAAFDRNGR